MSLSNDLSALADATREFDFSAQDFARVRKLIYQHAGISLNDTKQSMVYSRLARRLRALKLTSFVAYLDMLESNPSAAEWQEFVNSLTTNLTSFFRESHHFPALQDHLLKMSKQGRINIWCCASSTGEEPYSLAITAMEAFRSMTPPVRILATDIDTNVLRAAQAGVYRDEVVAKMDPQLLKKYFLKGSGEQAGMVRVRPELQEIISFRQLNLLENDWKLRPGFAAIFCRNVMIYFDKETQLKIIRRFAPLLNPEGLLFVGHSENFSQARESFVLKGKTIYEVVRQSAAPIGAPTRLGG
ncbi:CheR family methyltransferase [Parvibium lacunae]|uniref:Chemotaxis protein methyltransferase n=1 Tax=Parvibium lacunae TaxID=1888893 RepID=A0A368L867_9BURK|nr:CheR family methyltransferase [Parvibium lacunae]RCS59870.1 chemotaxis protein CheR [Parvibium lacunae]